MKDRAAIPPALAQRVAAAIGEPAIRWRPVKRRYTGFVYVATFDDGRSVVVKTGDDGYDPLLEATMLERLLRISAIPVPRVLAAGHDLLILEFIANDNRFTTEAYADLARATALLHEVTAPAYGLDFDTVIGTLPQPNAWDASWLAFFRDRRLVPMATACFAANRLPAATLERVEWVAGRLDRWIGEPGQPALIHGDLWLNNVLVRREKIVGFVDPAIYFGDSEIELAFATLFLNGAAAFVRAYAQHRPISPEFLRLKRHVYDVYHLLFHQRLFDRPIFLRRLDVALDRLGTPRRSAIRRAAR